MRIGKNMQQLLTFARKYPGWHTYRTDRTTTATVRRLVKVGLLKVNQYGQFSAV